VVDAAGTHPRRLTHSSVVDPNAALYPTPAWSPDGSRILTIRESGEGSAAVGIEIITVATGAEDVLTPSSGVTADIAPQWSGDGRYVVVASAPPNGPPALVVVDARNRTRQTLSGTTPAVDPRWQPTH
jgi:Tol biopolymer transport system component